MRHFDKDVDRIVDKKLKKLGISRDDIAQWNNVEIDVPKGYMIEHKRVIVRTKSNKFYVVYSPPFIKVKDA